MGSKSNLFDWFICKTCKKVFPIKKLLFLHKKSHEHQVEGKNTCKKGGKYDDSQLVKRRTVDNNSSIVQRTTSKDEKKKKKTTSTKALELIQKSKENFQNLIVKKAKKNFTFTPASFTAVFSSEKSPLLVPDVEDKTLKTPAPKVKDAEIEMICLSSDSEPEVEMDLDEKCDSDLSTVQKVVAVEKSAAAASPSTTFSAFETDSEKLVEKEEEKSSASSLSLSTSLSSTPGASIQQVSCPVCWKLVNEKVLAVHMRIRHLDQNQLSCLFPGCKQVFQTSEELTEHKKSHEPARPFACPVKSCGRTFLQSNHRSLHLKNHTAQTNMKKTTSLKATKSK